MKENGLRTGIRMAMAAVMAISMMAMPVYAADDTPATPNDKLTVGYTEKASFVLNIPTEVVKLSETEEKTAAIGLTSINVGTNQWVEIKVSAGITDGNVTLTDENDSTNTATSKVSLSKGNTGSGIAADTVVGLFENNSTTASTGTGTLYFAPLTSTTPGLTSVPAGTYSGTITFTAKIEPSTTAAD